MMSDAVRAVILGVIEGVTEFLPVSSTGHLLLAERFFNLGEGSFWNSFTVLIQLGAILAIVVIYFGKLWQIAQGMFTNPDDRRFVIGLLVAFLPAVVIGLIAGKYIKEVLFNPWVVCFSLIVGGAILLWVDQLDHDPHEHDATTFPLPTYLAIGFAQCLAMIPGVSRSGASIVEAMLFGADKHAAAEFSFFLAIPTMVGAFAYEFYKNRADISLDLKPRYHDALRFSLPMYFGIGVCQCLAMIPGVSRSGASIVAAMLFGADKHAAAEFSFFLAIPTMVGAFAYDFYKNRGEMTSDHLGIIAIGFVVSFITAIVVVKTFLSYVTRHGFVLFAWWRVIVGTLGLVALAMGR
jgi:undecaprenyl-diphosphatase